LTAIRREAENREAMQLIRLAVVILLLSGCGGPTDPSVDPPAPFSAAKYLFSLSADGSGCRDTIVPIITFVDARPRFTLDGKAWIARPEIAGANGFELRMVRSSVSVRTPRWRTPVTGTLTGFVRDEGNPSPTPVRGPVPLPPVAPRDIQVEALDGTADLYGAVNNDGTVGEGYIRSAVVFRGSTRAVSCAPGTVRWVLLRL
jgi:hypothetical protein